MSDCEAIGRQREETLVPAGARASGLSRAAISRSRHAGGMVDRMTVQRDGIPPVTAILLMSAMGRKRTLRGNCTAPVSARR